MNLAVTMLFKLLCFVLLNVDSGEALAFRGAGAVGNASSHKSLQGDMNASLARNTSLAHNASLAHGAAAWTFRQWYDFHAYGRGIWKWSNSLDSYQRHFGPYAGLPVSIGEVGVQSGGSILMWKAILGWSCRVFGIDINPACRQFADPTTTITIMNQGCANEWDKFYTSVAPWDGLDILLDDGSHQPAHMSLTLHKSFPHIKPGGYAAVEDIHGRHYVCSFFFPVANSIGNWNTQGLVDSVHIYPFQLLLRRAGGGVGYAPGPACHSVTDFPQLWPALAWCTGRYIYMTNPGWGSFLSESTMQKIFTAFAPLHDYTMASYPPGCEKTASPICTVGIVNSESQAKIIGVHVYQTYLAVEVAAAPPVIQAVRRGNQFIAYGR